MKSLRHSLTLLIASGLTMAALMALVAILGNQRAATAVTRAFVAKDVTADILPPPMYLIELRLVVSEAAEGTMTLDAAAAEAKRLAGEYGARVEYWTRHPPYGLETSLLGEQHDAGRAFIDAASALFARATSRAEVAAALPSLDGLYRRHRAGVDETVAKSLAFADASIAHHEATSAWIRWLLLGALVGTFAVLWALGGWVRRHVWAMTGGEPATAAAIAAEVARGNLAIDVPVDARDDTSLMARLREMQRSLTTLASEVRRISAGVATASHEIAQGNADLAARTERQASGLGEVVASMDALGGTAQGNAAHARHADQLARAAGALAARGGDVMSDLARSMDAINDSSRRIGDIVGVIDGIAFQTNILSLNAAVEAARAGEQGRGFAVVATEVRTLAAKSAAAAREIRALIVESTASVGDGSREVARAGEAMAGIVASVQEVGEIVNAISQSSIEQRLGVEQVGREIGQMDLVTQQNAALVEQSAAAAESLGQQARALVRAVEAFRVAPETGPR
ncbi:MAG: methyl-accepting chemotaxis protein [Lautropia sp.]